MSEQTQERGTFQQRTMERLERESRPDSAINDGPPPDLPGEQSDIEQVDATEVVEQQGGADQLDASDDQELIQPLGDRKLDQPSAEIDQPGPELDEGVDPDVEGGDGETELFVLRQRAEEAESKNLLMQQDYTKKTQEIGSTRRELTESLDQSKRIAKVYAERANTQLQRYDNVNWQQLQSQMSPQNYQSEVAKYQQIVQMRDHAVSEHQAIAKYADEQVELRKTEESEHSRDILRHAIPNWGNELYADLRTYADTWDFSAAEVDQITDHRIIRLLHNAYKMTQTGKKIQNIQQNGTSRTPGGPNKPARRDRDGRYATRAKQDHENNPGNRELTRNHFRERLRAERKRR